MAAPHEALARIVKYADNHMNNIEDIPIQPDQERNYAAQLGKSLENLQEQIRQSEANIQKLQQKDPATKIDAPANDATTRIQQLKTITAAYKKLASAEPLLPSTDSPLPALIALRDTLKGVDQTKRSMKACREHLAQAQTHWADQCMNVEESHETTKAIEERIKVLRLQRERMSEQGPDAVAAQILQMRQQRRMRYTKEFRRLVVAFNKFNDEHLATMLAAEQLGGPVVGDDPTMTETMLEAGFNKNGKVKKAKPKRDPPARMSWEHEEDKTQSKTSNLRAVAGADFRNLVEELLNASAEEETPNSYIMISAESAAVRFLVRAKVAEFHPTDARKLRLVNFGDDIDDEFQTASQTGPS